MSRKMVYAVITSDEDVSFKDAMCALSAVMPVRSLLSYMEVKPGGKDSDISGPAIVFEEGDSTLVLSFENEEQREMYRAAQRVLERSMESS